MVVAIMPWKRISSWPVAEIAVKPIAEKLANFAC